MEYAFSILMFAMGIGILLVAAIVYVTKKMDNYIMRAYAAKMKDPKKYAQAFGKLLALIGVAFILSAAVGLTQMYWLAVIVFVAGLIYFGKKGGRYIKEANE